MKAFYCTFKAKTYSAKRNFLIQNSLAALGWELLQLALDTFSPEPLSCVAFKQHEVGVLKWVRSIKTL